MGDVTADKNFAPVLTEIPRYQMPVSAPTTELAVRVRDRPLINLSLFFATLISTTMAGAYMANANLAFDLSADHPLLDLIRNLATGCSFSIPLIGLPTSGCFGSRSYTLGDLRGLLRRFGRPWV